MPGSTLLPSAPVLTRYAESMNPFAKRKLIEPTVPEEKVAMKLNNLAVPKLCVKLNTLQVSFRLITFLESFSPEFNCLCLFDTQHSLLLSAYCRCFDANAVVVV